LEFDNETFEAFGYTSRVPIARLSTKQATMYCIGDARLLMSSVCV